MVGVEEIKGTPYATQRRKPRGVNEIWHRGEACRARPGFRQLRGGAPPWCEPIRHGCQEGTLNQLAGAVSLRPCPASLMY